MSLKTLERGIRYSCKSYNELYKLAEKRGLKVTHVKRDFLLKGLILSKAEDAKGNYIQTAHYGDVAEWTEYNY